MIARPTICGTLLALLLALSFGSTNATEPISFRLMTFNILHGGVERGQPLSQTARAIKLADVVGLQETHNQEIDHSVELARLLGWHHFQQGGNTAVLSRYKITGHTPAKCGVYIELSSDLIICLFNVHFPASPYQPYQLLGIPYGDDDPFIKTEQEAIDWANRSRGSQLGQMLKELELVRERGIPVFVTGDFNEPSHLDWTERAAAAGVHPLKVDYPAARSVAEHGLIDAYRQQFPDELARSGFTWTPLTQPSDKDDHHDRIDFVFVDKRFAAIKNCEVVGEAADSADLVVDPWPSDHRAVLSTIQIKKQRD